MCVSFLRIFLLISVLIRQTSANLREQHVDEVAEEEHHIQILCILTYTCLLLITMFHIWLLSRFPVIWLHHTSIAIIFGLIIGGVIKFCATVESHHSFVDVSPTTEENFTAPPDVVEIALNITEIDGQSTNRSYRYYLMDGVSFYYASHFVSNLNFDSKLFFNVLLPPIIFYAGYTLNSILFFKNLSTIIVYGFVGPIVQAIVTGTIVYHLVNNFSHIFPTLNIKGTFHFSPKMCLLFASFVSSTDPVSVLSIFPEVGISEDTYSIAMGESVMNDVVALSLSVAVSQFDDSESMQASDVFRVLGRFLYLSIGSCLIGTTVGVITAVMTRQTQIRDLPLLESVLFVLISMCSFLIAEIAELSGIVSILFCAIIQGQYTFQNLSAVSQQRTLQLFEELNFLAENLLFSYIGVSMLTFHKHIVHLPFICSAFIAIIIARACSVYPVTWVMNLFLRPEKKISCYVQNVLFVCGLRGAMAFAMALKNTTTPERQVINTATSLVVVITVLFAGTAINILSKAFGIDRHHVAEVASLKKEVVEKQEAAPQPEKREEPGWLNEIDKTLRTRLTDAQRDKGEKRPQTLAALAAKSYENKASTARRRQLSSSSSSSSVRSSAASSSRISEKPITFEDSRKSTV